MAKLIKCKACIKEISQNAKQCPSCGEPVKKTSLIKIFFGVMFGIMVLPFIMMQPSNNRSPSASSNPTPPITKSPKVIKLEAKFGPRPEQSGWDGSYSEVKRHLKQFANDPDSIKIESCTTVSVDKKMGWLVGCDYRGTNKFGGKVLNSNWFIIKNGEVIKTLPISAYKI